MRKPEQLPKRKGGSLEERKNRRTAESKGGSSCGTEEWDGLLGHRTSGNVAHATINIDVGARIEWKRFIEWKNRMEIYSAEWKFLKYSKTVDGRYGLP